MMGITDTGKKAKDVRDSNKSLKIAKARMRAACDAKILALSRSDRAVQCAAAASNDVIHAEEAYDNARYAWAKMVIEHRILNGYKLSKSEAEALCTL